MFKLIMKYIHKTTYLLIIFFLLSNIYGCAITIPTKINFSNNKNLPQIIILLEFGDRIQSYGVDHVSTLKEAFKRNGIFRILTNEDIQLAEYKINIKESFHNKAFLPPCGDLLLGTVLTLGIFPAWCNHEYYSSYSITELKSGKSFIVEYQDEPTSLAGIWTIPLRFSDTWAARYDFDRYYDHVVDEVHRKIISLNI